MHGNAKDEIPKATPPWPISTSEVFSNPVCLINGMARHIVCLYCKQEHNSKLEVVLKDLYIV